MYKLKPMTPMNKFCNFSHHIHNILNKNHLILFIALLSTLSVIAQESAPVNYIPKISGVMRGRWEIETETGDNRFAIRNARIKIQGNIARPIDYTVQADLCELGDFKFLDAYIRLKATKFLQFKVGQFRVPFGVDPFRGPANFLFANRSFIGRDMANMRSVGVSVAYNFDKIPLNIEAGVFNNTPITEHSKFNGDKVFASKAVYTLGNFQIVGGFESIIPDSVRMNQIDAAVVFTHDRWHVEAEYINIHYTNSAFSTCNAYNIFANYSMPIKLGVFNGLSFQARWEGSDAYSNGKYNDDGNLYANHPERNRLTLGSTLTYKLKNLRCDLRLNYEKYFYDEGQIIPEGRTDKICAELVVVF